MSSTNGGQNGGPAGPHQAGAAQTLPQINVLAQYIKDFSFENPLAPRGPQGLQQNQQPAINIQVGVQARPLAEPDVEVMLKIDGKATLPDNQVLFAFELEYAGVFRIQNVPPESVQPIVLIECPRLLFPFAREIIATTVASGGFPALMLDPVDFVGLYRQNLAKVQGGAGAPMQA